jgi:UDPglucose 6-dehydrogenase
MGNRESVMKIAIVGLWHLGAVTAACLANKNFYVIAYDENKAVIDQLNMAKPPLFEPGLEAMIADNLKQNRLFFTNYLQDISQADLVWVTYDTPVDEEDKAEVNVVVDKIIGLFPYLKKKACLLISSQLPVGTIKGLETVLADKWREIKVNVACSPENLRLGKAIEVFENSERIVVGIRNAEVKNLLAMVLDQFTDNIIWMTVEGAEMTKHAINAFLAMSVVFANEMASLCEQTGVDAFEVEQGLKSENRIGRGAYVRPGNAFAGGTLARDVQYLIALGEKHTKKTPLLSAIMTSNHLHRHWVCQKLEALCETLKGKTIALLGLTYKSGTDTLRRSTAVEIAKWCMQQAAHVKAYDPGIKESSSLIKNIHLCQNIELAMDGADVVIVATEHPEFKSLISSHFDAYAPNPIVLDGGGFLRKNLEALKNIHYFRVGKNQCG